MPGSPTAATRHTRPGSRPSTWRPMFQLRSGPSSSSSCPRIRPAGPVAGSWVNAEVSSTTLLLVSIALFRAKRVGLWLALALLGAAFVVQGAIHHHVVAAAVAIAVGALLLATRRRYAVRTGSTELLVAAALVGAGGFAVLLDATLASHAAHVAPRV